MEQEARDREEMAQRREDARREAEWRKRKEEEAAQARRDKIADRKAAHEATAATRPGSPRAARPQTNVASPRVARPHPNVASPRTRSSGYGQSSGYGSPRAASSRTTAANDDALGRLGQDLLSTHISPPSSPGRSSPRASKKKIVVRYVSPAQCVPKLHDDLHEFTDLVPLVLTLPSQEDQGSDSAR